MDSFLSKLDQSLGGSHGLNTNTEEKIGKYNVVIKQRLAEGAYGLVDLVLDSVSHKEFVLKRCSIQRQETYDIVCKEIKMLTMFSGPYVVEYFGSEIVSQTRGREALILLGYCPGGNLFQKLSSRGSSNYIPLNNCLSIFQQILLAVQRFHEHNPPVTHRDLKLENILFSADNTVRLCDFGSCCIGYPSLRNQVERTNEEEILQKETTPMYRAPEMIDLYMREELTEKTDIWALGCIFSTICYLKHPFQDVGSLGILNGKILPFPTDSPMPPYIKDFIMRMLDPDPEARPSIAEILPWIKCMTQNQSLPLYELSDIAKMKREQRLQANSIREQKNVNNQKNKNKAIVPERPKHSTPMIASDSVAAKRLAAKRGGGGIGGGTDFPTVTNTTADIHNNDLIFDVNFDNFNITNEKTSSTSIISSTPQSMSVFGFDSDPFANGNNSSQTSLTVPNKLATTNSISNSNSKTSSKRPSSSSVNLLVDVDDLLGDSIDVTHVHSPPTTPHESVHKVSIPNTATKQQQQQQQHALHSPQPQHAINDNISFHDFTDQQFTDPFNIPSHGINFSPRTPPATSSKNTATALATVVNSMTNKNSPSLRTSPMFKTSTTSSTSPSPSIPPYVLSTPNKSSTSNSHNSSINNLFDSSIFPDSPHFNSDTNNSTISNAVLPQTLRQSPSTSVNSQIGSSRPPPSPLNRDFSFREVSVQKYTDPFKLPTQDISFSPVSGTSAMSPSTVGKQNNISGGFNEFTPPSNKNNQTHNRSAPASTNNLLDIPLDSDSSTIFTNNINKTNKVTATYNNNTNSTIKKLDAHNNASEDLIDFSSGEVDLLSQDVYPNSPNNSNHLKNSTHAIKTENVLKVVGLNTKSVSYSGYSFPKERPL